MANGRRRSTGERWGEMTDREREETLQFLRERFPVRYRELIERYQRALAKEDRP